QRVSPDQQRKAVEFLLANGFATNKRLLDPAVVNRIKYAGAADEIASRQKSLLRNLLSPQRFRLLLDAEALENGSSYAALPCLAGVQAGVWSEVRTPQPRVDTLRRGLQRAYLEHVKDELSPKAPAATPMPPTLPGRRGGAMSKEGGSTDFRAVA